MTHYHPCQQSIRRCWGLKWQRR